MLVLTHVLSSLIRRFHEAKSSGAVEVVLWGSGAPRREFVHADDIAEACIRLLTRDTTTLPLPVNIGTGTDYSIQQLAVLIARVIGFEGQIVWDHSKPDGAPCKLLDSSRMETAIGVSEQTAPTAPILLESRGCTNIVYFRGRFYAVPQALGPVDFNAPDLSNTAFAGIADSLPELISMMGVQ